MQKNQPEALPEIKSGKDAARAALKELREKAKFDDSSAVEPSHESDKTRRKEASTQDNQYLGPYRDEQLLQPRNKDCEAGLLGHFWGIGSSALLNIRGLIAVLRVLGGILFSLIYPENPLTLSLSKLIESVAELAKRGGPI